MILVQYDRSWEAILGPDVQLRLQTTSTDHVALEDAHSHLRLLVLDRIRLNNLVSIVSAIRRALRIRSVRKLIKLLRCIILIGLHA